MIADWAPMTSLLSRLTSAPVRVRVKNATGIRCTCSKTARRRSTIRPSPIREENHRDTRPTTASSTASAAMPAASPITVAAAAETSPPRHDRVHHPSGEHRREHADRRGQHGEQQEREQPPPVGRGERQIRGIVPFFTDVGASTPRATPRIIPQVRSIGGPFAYTVAAVTINADAAVA